MNKTIIYKYINNLKKEDILTYASKQGINLTNDELNLIFNSIKNNPNNILSNPLLEINKLKDKLNINTYHTLLNLYDKYKQFFNYYS